MTYILDYSSNILPLYYNLFRSVSTDRTGGLGFEPRSTESESVVITELHQPPITRGFRLMDSNHLKIFWKKILLSYYLRLLYTSKQPRQDSNLFTLGQSQIPCRLGYGAKPYFTKHYSDYSIKSRSQNELLYVLFFISYINIIL